MKLLTNNAVTQGGRIAAFDGSLAAVDEPSVINCVGGPRHLKYTQSGTAARSVLYVNTGGMTVDTIALIRAEKHLGKSVALVGYSTFSSSKTNLETSGTWAPVTIGVGQQDYILEFTQASYQAVGVEFNSTDYTKDVHSLYCGAAFSFPAPGQVSASFQPVSAPVQVGFQNYLVNERCRFIWPGLSLANVQALQNDRRISTEPVVFIDTDETLFLDGMYHCIVAAMAFDNIGHDVFSVTFDLYRLRHYDAVFFN